MSKMYYDWTSSKFNLNLSYILPLNIVCIMYLYMSINYALLWTKNASKLKTWICELDLNLSIIENILTSILRIVFLKQFNALNICKFWQPKMHTAYLRYYHSSQSLQPLARYRFFMTDRSISFLRFLLQNDSWNSFKARLRTTAN